MPVVLSSVGRSFVVALLVTACASSSSPTPSSSPSATAPPATAGTPSPAATPPTIAEVSLVVAGGRHTCAVTSEGGVKCWGANDFGQLGTGTTTESSVPTDVAGLARGVIAISAGGAHTCALTSDGKALCWGSNGSGQLGDGSTTDSTIPVGVAGLEEGVTAVAAGGSHTCALTNGGGVWCWGYNEYQQLGTGSATSSSIPLPVSGLSSGAIAIVTSDLHSCALMGVGGVKCWGYGPSGGLGTGVPGDVPGLADTARAIAATYEQTCALTTDGKVLCWGGFDGTGAVDVFYYLDVRFQSISGGFGQICALTTDEIVMCWAGLDSSDPVVVEGLIGGTTAIAAGGAHACALTRSSAVMCWGDNWSGQLGNGRPCSSWGNSRTAVAVDLAASGAEPSGSPTEFLEHATGSTDVLLRFNRQPDFGVGDLEGELFQPGPEFTLYGDGTVIFRDDLAELPPRDGYILRVNPFLTAQLDEAQIQSLLAFAIAKGGLGSACAEYGTTDTDVVGFDGFTIHAGDVDKDVVDTGSGPFGVLREHLGNFAESGIATSVWAPDRYWGNLLDATIFQYISDGTTPGLAEFGTVPWPWPAIKPADFVPADAHGNGDLRRILTPEEASVLGLSDDGGVVKRIYIVGPDGYTIYYFSMWPVAPDEAR
jgi:Regulator of chromosome condensation (RCC1) repeat